MISNTTRSFQYFCQKILKFRHFCFFRKTLELEKFQGADFKYDNSFSNFYPENTEIRHFWGRIETKKFFRKILHFIKFDVSYFKSHNSFSKFEPKGTPNKALLIPGLGIFVSSPNFTKRQIWASSFKYDDSFLKFYPQNTQTRHFWVII